MLPRRSSQASHRRVVSRLKVTFCCAMVSGVHFRRSRRLWIAVTIHSARTLKHSPLPTRES
jgi:hypothetical protein